MLSTPEPVVATDSGPAVDPELLAFARELMTDYHTPGVGIGVSRCGRTALAGLGVTNLDNPLPVDGDTLFQIGSITKTMTGTAIMCLIERGALALDAPVRRYLPDFAVADPEVSEAVTIRHLMTHSAGWEGDVFEDFGWGDDALGAMVGRMSPLRQQADLGSMWSYNNAAFYVLGRILEIVHGEPYDRAMRHLLFDPLGMEDACFFAHDVILRRHAIGHAIGSHGLQVARPWALPRSSFPVVGVTASPRDMMRYARLHLGTLETTSDLISRDTLDLMHAPGLPDGTAGDQTGRRAALTWWIDDRSDQHVLHHPGGANGQPADLYLIPSESFGLVVLTNCQRNANQIAARLLRWAQQRYFDVARPAVHAASAAAFGDLSAAEGTYEGYVMRFEVRRDGEVLRLDMDAKSNWLDGLDPEWEPVRDVELVPIGPDTVVAHPLEENDPIVFLRDADGQIRWMHHLLRASRRQ